MGKLGPCTVDGAPGPKLLGWTNGRSGAKMRDLNRMAKRVTNEHQRGANIGRVLVNRNAYERQGTRLAWYIARQPGVVIRFRNPAVVSVS